MTKNKNLPAGTDAVEAPAKHETPTTEKAPSTRNLPWFRLTVIVIFALFYAYELFEAINNTLGVTALINQLNKNPSLNAGITAEIPWVILIANMLLPLVVFGLGLLITRKRNVGVLAIVLLAGLGVIGALTLNFTVLVGLTI